MLLAQELGLSAPFLFQFLTFHFCSYVRWPHTITYMLLHLCGMRAFIQVVYNFEEWLKYFLKALFCYEFSYHIYLCNSHPFIQYFLFLFSLLFFFLPPPSHKVVWKYKCDSYVWMSRIGCLMALTSKPTALFNTSIYIVVLSSMWQGFESAYDPHNKMGMQFLKCKISDIQNEK